MNNLATRIVSATVYAIVMLAAMFAGRYVFAAVFIFIMCASMAEFYRITIPDGRYAVSRILMIAGAVTFFVTEFCIRGYGLDHRFEGLAILPVAAAMTAAMLRHDRESFTDFAFIATGLLYIGVPIALSNSLVFDAAGCFSGKLLLCFFLMIWGSDVGAYILGMSFGQKPDSRKLCPDISPKKSWIGFWGGLAFGILAAFIARWASLVDIPAVHCIGLGAVTSVASVFGDLFESMWKRSFSLKDSGNIIPGHGGMLDRFDSSLIAIPVGALYLFAFGLI